MFTQDDQLAEARARLLAERAEVLKELEQLNARLEVKGDYELGEGDPMIYQWELNLALRERAELGLYGRCERCGKPIEPERLAVLTHTTVCSQCAQRRR